MSAAFQQVAGARAIRAAYVPNDLGALTASAYAAGLRLSDAYRNGTEEQVAALEMAADDAHSRLRAKLAELGVDPHMLRVVIQ